MTTRSVFFKKPLASTARWPMGEDSSTSSPKPSAIPAARVFAEAIAKPEQLKAAKRLETNAGGYVEAAELGQALAEYEKARVAYEKLLPSAGTATLEQAVAARTAMLAGYGYWRYCATQSLPRSSKVKCVGCAMSGSCRSCSSTRSSAT